MAELSTLNTKQKAAAVIISLGMERASKIYKYLNEAELEQLTLEVAKLNKVRPEDTETALDDFHKMCLTQKFVSDGGLDYAKSVLEKAFGISVANSLLERISKTLQTRAFEFVRKADSKNLLTLIHNERPQTIALILSYARSDQAADVIAELPKNKRIAVVECIAKMDRAAPDAIKRIEAVLERQFASIFSMDFTTIGGVDYIADVMNNMDRANEKFVFDELAKKDAKLADDIRKRMFVFEDITILDNMAIQRFIKEIDTHDLVYALKGTNQDVSSAIFANMSTRMAESVQSDLEITFNVRVRDVEEAQQRIVATIRRLEEEGELVIMKGGKDEIIA
ncbi:MAG: flagellar motor switch protein FliG [Oscillospiraceae bacterium]|nr:flagellar motor switch protein FliG [Oscillospiraceae bacterium]